MVNEQQNNSGGPVKNLDRLLHASVGQAPRNVVIQQALPVDAGQDQNQPAVQSLGRPQVAQKWSTESPERVQQNTENRLAAAQKTMRQPLISGSCRARQ